MYPKNEIMFPHKSIPSLRSLRGPEWQALVDRVAGLPETHEDSLAFCSPSPEDINDDGLYDLVCHFYTQKAGFMAGDEEASLKGYMNDGEFFWSTDVVNIVPKGK